MLYPLHDYVVDFFLPARIVAIDLFAENLFSRCYNLMLTAYCLLVQLISLICFACSSRGVSHLETCLVQGACSCFLEGALAHWVPRLAPKHTERQSVKNDEVGTAATEASSSA